MLQRANLLGRKYLLVVLLAGVTFSAATAVCVARDCICVIRQVDTIEFPNSRAGLVAVNPTTGLLYVSVDDALEIAVFDTAHLDTGPLARVPTEGYHGGIAVDDRTNRIYVVQSFAQRVRVIDGVTHAYHDIEVPGLVNAMSAVAVDPERRRLYVARADNLDIAVFDTATEAFLGTIGQGCCPSGNIDLALDRVTGLLFVMNAKPGQVSVFQGGGRRVAEIPVGDGPADIALDPEARRTYVTKPDSLSVSVIDMAPESPTAFTVVGNIPMRNNPSAIAIDSGARRAYVTNTTIDTLSIIDLSAARHVQELRIGFQPQSIALDPVTAHAYASLSDGHVAVVQGCPAPRRAEEAARRSAPVAVAAPSVRPDATAEAERRLFVRCNRMFRIRTQCAEGPDVHEAPLAQATIEASGARVLDGGSAGQFCGVPPDYHEADLVAAGFYYSVPVVEPGANTPTVWTFHSTTRTLGQHPVPADTVITRVTAPPATPWQEALWYLSRYQTGLAPEAGCDQLP